MACLIIENSGENEADLVTKWFANENVETSGLSITAYFFENLLKIVQFYRYEMDLVSEKQVLFKQS